VLPLLVIPIEDGANLKSGGKLEHPHRWVGWSVETTMMWLRLLTRHVLFFFSHGVLGGVNGLLCWQRGNVGNIDCIALLDTEVVARRRWGGVLACHKSCL
jgi:hypothetical protein